MALSLLGPKVQSLVMEFPQAAWHDQKKKKEKGKKKKEKKKKKKENKKNSKKIPQYRFQWLHSPWETEFQI